MKKIERRKQKIRQEKRIDIEIEIGEADESTSSDYENKLAEYQINPTIKLFNVNEHNAARVISHEMLHHVLLKLVGKEACGKLDADKLDYLGYYLYPEAGRCLYCQYYTPSPITLYEGYCRKHDTSGVSVDSYCEEMKLSEVFKRLPLSEFEIWREYREGYRDKIAELADSKSLYVAHEFRKKVEHFRKFTQEKPDQFKMDCKHLGEDCFPVFCHEHCDRFESKEFNAKKSVEEAKQNRECSVTKLPSFFDRGR